MDRDTAINPVIARRTALVVGLGGAGALALAACGSSGGTSAAQSASGAGATPGTRKSSGSKGIARLDSIKVGSSAGAQLNGNPVLVARPSADTAVCFSAICTHAGCVVDAAGDRFRCPCHGSVYNAMTGAVIQGPAPRPLPKIPVRIQKGEIVPD